MEVILRQDVEKLGRQGDVVKVAEGYGRNFLLPSGLALQVNAANRAMIEKERKAHEARMAKEKAECQSLAARLGALKLVALRKAGENDALFGSVTHADVADLLAAKGIEIDKRRVLVEEPLKKLGEFEVKIRLHPEVTAVVQLVIAKEE